MLQNELDYTGTICINLYVCLSARRIQGVLLHWNLQI